MYGELPSIQTATGEAINAYPVVILKPAKTAALRLPTNAEMLEYLGKRRFIVRDLGRRISESEMAPNPTADLDLFKKIRLDKGEEFDEFEAAKALQKLTHQRIKTCERDGDDFRITLLTAFGPTVHVLGMPTERDLAIYRRNVYKSRDLPNNLEERRFPPEVPSALYDSVVQSVTGYIHTIKTTDVPPHHKSAVIIEATQALAELDPDLDPN